MEIIIEFFGHLSNPDWILENGGLNLVLIILFIETGLFFGFFLPGDPLLFISGMIIAGADGIAVPFHNQIYSLLFWEVLFILSTVLGNMVGYWSGKKFGHLFKGKDRWFLSSKHIESAEGFYKKRGGFAILIARFLPIARTFVPIVGGVVRMNFAPFMIYNVLGAILWVGLLTTLGFILGGNLWIEKNLEYVILGIALLASLPVLFKMVFKSRPVLQKS